jgi:predicted ATPase
MQERFPEISNQQPALLAHHFTEAGLVEEAVAYWGKAGRRSADRSAMAEAAAQFQKGLDQLALLPDTYERRRQEFEFRAALGAVLMIVKGYAAPETGQAFTRARELWGELGSPSEVTDARFGELIYHNVRGDLALSLRLAEDLLRLSVQRKDSGGIVLGHASCGGNLFYMGQFAQSRSHLEEGLSLYDPSSHRSLVDQAGFHPQVRSQAQLGLALFCLGYSDQAIKSINAATAEARRLAHLPTLANALGWRTLLSLVEEDARLSEGGDELAAVATEQGFPHWRAFSTIYHGWAQVKDGDVAEGISLLRSGSTAFRAAGAQMWTPHNIALLARACELEGRFEEALTLLDESLQIVDRTGERWFAAELYRKKGEFLLRRGHPDTAEELYREAENIAATQGAKFWALRTAVSLARLWRDQGRRAEASERLAPVYGALTEGFDTPDLREAKALLDELAA